MTDTPAVSLASLMIPSRAVDVPFEGFEGLTIKLVYLSRSELIKLRKKCVTSKFSRSTRQPEETLDDEKFLKEYCTAVIQGWEGFKYRYLEELLLVDINALDPEDEMPFTVDNAVELMKNSSDFDSWVMETVGDLENFTTNK
jgi:hypothetical protein